VISYLNERYVNCIIISQSDVEEESTIPITPEPRRLNQLQAYSTSPSSPETENAPEEDQTLRSPAMSSCYIYSITEETESEETTSSSTIESVEPEPEETLATSIPETSSSSTQMPLRDLTNTTARATSTPKITKSRRKVRFDDEIDSQEATIRRGPQQSSPTRRELSRNSPKKRTVHKKGAKYDKSIECENLEPSIQQVRHAPKQSSPIHQALPSNSLNAGPDYSPRPSQLNFEHFNGIVYRPGNCSTPRQERDTIATNRKAGWKRTKSTVNSSRESEEHTSSESTLTGRPSRSCRPKSLKEPSARGKLRNESAVKL